MMAKTVNLSVHKNTVERRRKHVVAKDLRVGVDAIMKEADLRAYAFVGIGANGKAYALWDTGAVLPMWAFPQTIARMLERDMEASGLEEDWRPPVLPVKGSEK